MSTVKMEAKGKERGKTGDGKRTRGSSDGDGVEAISLSKA